MIREEIQQALTAWNVPTRYYILRDVYLALYGSTYAYSTLQPARLCDLIMDQGHAKIVPCSLETVRKEQAQIATDMAKIDPQAI